MRKIARYLIFAQNQSNFTAITLNDNFDKILNMTHYDSFNECVNSLKSGTIILTENKKEKIESDWTTLINGETFIVLDDLNNIPKILSHFKNNNIQLVYKPKNHFNNPLDSGYRDMILHVKYQNGHLMKIQINIKPMLQAKENFTQKHYEEAHTLDAKRKKENRAFTPEEQQQVDELDRKAKDVHDKAWMESIKQNTSNLIATKLFMNKKSLNQNIYFEYNDSPAIWEKPHYPVIYKNSKADEPKSIMDWILNRRTISKDEFDKLMKIHGGHHV